MQVSGRMKQQGLPQVRRLLALLGVGTSVAALYTGECRCGPGSAMSKDRLAGLSAGLGTVQPISYETGSREGKSFSQQRVERRKGGEAGRQRGLMHALAVVIGVHSPGHPQIRGNRTNQEGPKSR